jgi:hypothetical protein
MLKQPELSAEHLYFELGRLIAETPADLSELPPSEEKTKWLAPAMALVECVGDLQISAEMYVAVKGIGLLFASI